MTYFYIKYVSHKDIPKYEKLGWKISDRQKPCHHCYYGKMMKWEGEGEPKEPSREISLDIRSE